MTIRRPQATFDEAARHPDGTLNHALQQALINSDSRVQVIERALGIGGLDPNDKSKVSPKPPRPDVAVTTGQGQFTVSITNPEFIRGRGNPLRNPIYHKVRYSPDPTFRTAVKELPPSVQTHFPILGTARQRLHAQVISSFDGVNWSLPVVVGPFSI